MTSFLLLNHDFFFEVSRPAQNAVPVPFFGGGFSKLFFNLRGISVQ
jgi:hypothetical protein